MLKVLLADERNIVRKGIKSLLEEMHNIKVVCEASSSEEILEQIAGNCDLDILLTEMDMPGIKGVQLIDKLHPLAPALKIIILSSVNQDEDVLQALKAGAEGYLLKDVSREELIFAINHIASGARYVCSDLSLHFIEKLYSREEAFSSVKLTNREREILELISEGYTNTEIADKLFTSKRTVEGHRLNLCNKTGTKNTAMLMQYAYRAGLLK